MLIGLVGKPSSGKSTFFQALTSVPVQRAPYPFTTIKPNHGVAYVEVSCPEKELNVKCKPKTGYCIDARRFVPVEVLDVAGLVPGAHEGKGLGNKFLDDLRQADVLIHIVDISGSTNEVGEPVESGSHDPADDVVFLEDELNHWILGIVEENWDKFVRENKQGKKPEEIFSEQFSGLGISGEVIQKTLKELNLKEKRLEEWSEEEKFKFSRIVREKGKQIIIAANKCDLPNGPENFKKLKEKFPEKSIVACSAEAEITLKEAAKNKFIDYVPGDPKFNIVKDLNEQQMKAMRLLEKVIVEFKGTGVQKALSFAVFDFLKYIAVFPVATSKLSDTKGNILPDCFLMKPESTAHDLAKQVHSQMADKFIKAIDMKTKKVLGADYILKTGDVLEIVFGK